MTTTDDAPSAGSASIVPPRLGYTTLAFAALVGGYVLLATDHELPRAVHIAAMYVLPVAAVAFCPFSWGYPHAWRSSDSGGLRRVRLVQIVRTAPVSADIDEP